MSKNPKHGGKREGAGRPPLTGGPLVSRSFTLSSEQLAYLTERGEGNASAGLRAVLRDAMKAG